MRSRTVKVAAMGAITVFLADDSAIIRAGVTAMLQLDPDVEVVGTADDYDSLVAGAEAANPDVIVSDIRMPPYFTSEGIDACKEIRKRHPGTGVVILSQYDDPDYAVSLLAQGSAGYAYLLKDRIAEGDQLARAIREVATGGSMLDPVIVSALINPVRRTGGLSTDDEELLELVANGRTIKAIAGVLNTTPSAVDDRVERLFVNLASGVSSGQAGALDRLRRLHQAIVEREEQGESLSRLLPTGVADQLLAGGRAIGETETLEVTVVMSDIRGYTSIAEHADPAVLAQQLNRHRAEMNRAILSEGGTVMQYVGDAVMAVFGAPVASEDHADRSLTAALAMHRAQDAVNEEWIDEGRTPFGLGIGLSTGTVAAALLGQRGAGGVHARRRCGEPVPAPSTVRRAGPDGSQRTDMERPHGAADRLRAARFATRQGARHTGRPVPVAEAGPPRTRRSVVVTDTASMTDATEAASTPAVATDLAVEVITVYRTFEQDTAPVRALRGADLAIERGEFVAVMGPSGCGKSTMLNLVAGLDVPDEGEVIIAGESLAGKDENTLAIMRREHVGIVFQFFNLLEGMTVLENVVMPAVIAGRKRKVAESRARDLLDLLGIGDKAKQAPGVLSGGQRQRLAIARALANEPTIVLADEPTGALDSEGGEEVLELFRRLHQGGQTILLVTHDQPVACAAERIVRMKDGRVDDDGLG